MKNYSDLIKSKEQRILTAKGYKFVWKCIDIVAKQNNTSRYSNEIKRQKDLLKKTIEDLIFEKGLSISEIKSLIKDRFKKIS